MSNPAEGSRSLFARFRRVEIPLRAAALGYHSVLSLIPAVGLILWYLRVVGVAKPWRVELQNFILSRFDVAASEELLKYIGQLTGALPGKNWGWLGVLVLVYTTANLVVKAGDSLDLIIDSSAPNVTTRPHFLFILVRRVVVMILLPVAVSLSFFAGLWIRQESWLASLIDFRRLGPLASVPGTIFLSVLAIFLFYQFMPARAVRWQAAVRAALVVGPVFEIAKVIMGAFSRHAIQVQKLYGAFAALPIFIIWTQVAWMILLCGALLIRPKDHVLR